MDLTSILTLSWIVTIPLWVASLGMLKFGWAYKANWAAHKLEWCVSRMFYDVALGTEYVMSSSRAAQWWMLLKYIQYFWCIAWMHYAIIACGMIAFDISWATSCRSCQLGWFLTISETQNKISCAFTRTSLGVIVGMGCSNLHFSCCACQVLFKNMLKIFLSVIRKWMYAGHRAMRRSEL